MNKKIEILAPAGSQEGMRAAMNAGCDAVYIGGSSFGARAYANNLEEDILLRAIDEAHIRNKRLYLTVNTLLKEQERVAELYHFLEKVYLQGLDAVIVQDVGVLHFIHQNFPELPIHASTQTTLTMAEGANLLKPYGVTRLVTARELSLKEIQTIRANTDLEIETFVHGALCYCYSGQCLMSSMIGGRSGNRGRCAQPCRMPYQFYSEGRRISSEQEKYLLSPKDINTITIIPELVEAGIDSFKIEGRMKRPEYAAAVSSLYRKYVDLYFELGKEQYHNYLGSNEFSKDMLLLQDVYNRGGFSEGYGRIYHGKIMMSLYRPNHSGVFVGKVSGIKGSRVSIELSETVNAQDILEIRHTKRAEAGYEFTVKDQHGIGEVLETNVGLRPDNRKPDTKSQESRTQSLREPLIHQGDLVYRTKNNQLLERLEEEYIAKDCRVGICGYLKAKLGEQLMLTLSYGECSVTAYRDIVQEALKQPMTKEKLSAPIEKTGDTLYFFEELLVDSDDNIFVPVAWLNEIRREAIVLLQEAVAGQYRRNKALKQSARYEAFTNEASTKEALTNDVKESSKLGICVSVQTREQLEQALIFPEVKAVYADYDMLEREHFISMAEDAVKAGKEFFAVLGHICRLSEFGRLKRDLSEIIENEAIHGFVVKNFEEITLLQSLWSVGKQQKRIILNYNMYIYNREAKAFWNELGITQFTAPVELNYQELKMLGISDCDLIVYGYQPVMVSAQCLFESTQGCKKCKENNKGYLTDRLGKKFYVQTNCNGCYNIIYNGQALSLLKQEKEIFELAPGRIRLDFTKETKKEMQQVISAFIAVFQYGYKMNRPTIELKNNSTVTNSLVMNKHTQELTDYTTGHFKRGVE